MPFGYKTHIYKTPPRGGSIMVSPPQMPVPLKHMYNANILRAYFTTFVPSYTPMWHTIKRHKLSFLKKKQLREWYASQLDFELSPLMWKRVQFAQISINIIAPIPRIDTNLSHLQCPSENLTYQLYLISQIEKTVCAYNLYTELQHSCIFLNSSEAETTI